MADPSGAGIPVDISGGSTADPTRNVRDLVDAASQRQDDLRVAINHRFDSELVGLRERITETRTHIESLLMSYDKRYEQRHEAAQRALEAALVAQKEAVREAFAAQREAINAALASADRAVSKAEIASEKRFDAVNEFRGQLGDQQRTLMPRMEAENRIASLAEKLAVLEGFRTEMLSKGTGSREGYAFAIGVIGVVLTILSVIGGGIALLSRIRP
jgi:ferritin-like metal-binding protein YciE